MHRIDSDNARPNANGAGKAGYHLNTDLSGVDPTHLDPAALNALQEELCTVIETAEIELEKGTNNQLLAALQVLFASISGNTGKNFHVANGTEETHAVNKGQLGTETVNRENGDITLAIALAAEITAREALTLQIMNKAWPIGSVYENTVNSLNPADASLLGFGTWVATQAGRVSIGYQAGDALFGVVGNEGGVRNHKMTAGNLIQHDHDRNVDGLEESVNVDSSGTVAGSYSPGANYLKLYTKTGKAGLADPDPIPTLPPYHVSYKWVRTA